MFKECVMTSSSLCDIHLSNNASTWCSQCEQRLCDDCVLYHNQANLSKNHETVTIDNFNRLPCFVKTIRRTCDEHDGKADFYCPIHESLCCLACVQSHHKLCGVNSIQNQAENIKQSATMEELESSLQDLRSNMKDVLQDRESNIGNIDNQKTSLVQQISDVKKLVIDHFDALEQKVIEDVTDVVKKEKVRQDKLVSELKEKQSEVSKICGDLENIKLYASSIDAFLALQTLCVDVQTQKQYFDSIQNDTSLFHTEIIFEKSESIKTLRSTTDSLGKIVIVSKPHLLQYKERKTKQAQLFINDNRVDKPILQGSTVVEQNSNQPETELEEKSSNDNTKSELSSKNDRKCERNANVKMGESEQSHDSYNNNLIDDKTKVSGVIDRAEHDISVSLEEKIHFPFKTRQLTAVKMFSSDKFAFIDHNGQRLVLYNKNTNNFKNVNFNSRPVDLTFKSPNTVAVTIHSAQSVAFVEFSSGREFDLLKTDGHCFGIDFDGKNYYVSIPKSKLIHIIGSTTDRVRKISTKYSGFYLVKHDDRIVCSNHIDNVVFCLSASGSHLWQLRSNNLLEPFCMSTNLKGDIFVTGRKSRTVSKLSIDGRSSDVIKMEMGEVTIPRALDYCIECENIIVCDERLDLGAIFHLKQASS